MNKRILLITVTAAMTLAVTAYAVSGGSQSDPVISKSYLEGALALELKAAAQEEISGRLESVYGDSFFKLAQEAAKYNYNLAASDTSGKSASGIVRLKAGDVIDLEAGTSVILDSGAAAISGGASDVTSGAAASGSMTASARYMATESASVTVSSATCQLQITGGYTLSYSSATDYNSLAYALNEMGLFRGDTTGFALERASTRTEGLVMFIRLMGLESQALAYTGSHPFTDVDAWASPYVAYAYNMGYTKGVSDTRFGSKDLLTPAHYVTFLMRALGFTENTDFAWTSAMNDAVRLGLVNAAERARLDTQSFLRSEVAYLSYYALFADTASGTPLMERLIAGGALDRQAVIRAMSGVSGTRG